MEKVCIIKEEIHDYPGKENCFRPSEVYPEYLFKDVVSVKENKVYKMVREGFSLLGLDSTNEGTSQWNPLGHLIKPGDTVLIKPNLVLHENISGGGTECLYTNPSLVAPMIDYTCIALKGKGKIIVGDAPLQECEFDTLIKDAGYDVLIDFYKKKGVSIELVDFRNVKTIDKDGIHYLQESEGKEGKIVRLDDKSAFSEIAPERLEKLRITNYDPKILKQHHTEGRHEYNVSQYVLNADVIINMPKPKTHRKAGVTVSLKNLVGINANKEFLPHHTLGSKEEGGDAYLHTDMLLELANRVLDIRNQLVRAREIPLAEKTESLYRHLYEKGKRQSGEEYWEGSWYGNDTIWRTIVDLNRILFYADKNGKMSDDSQRKMFIVGDMIVSGEKEGPLEPSPIYPGVIVMGEDPVMYDRVVCSLMGFDYRDIPSLYNEALFDEYYPISRVSQVAICSCYDEWNEKTMDEIRDRHSLEFQPPIGWAEKLGNKYRDKLYNRILEEGGTVYVFGSGNNGLYAAGELQKHGITVAAFCDNNHELWGREIIDGIRCVELSHANMKIPFIIAVQEKNVKEINLQLAGTDVKVLGIINK